jgi:hypothetical protein
VLKIKIKILEQFEMRDIKMVGFIIGIMFCFVIGDNYITLIKNKA